MCKTKIILVEEEEEEEARCRVACGWAASGEPRVAADGRHIGLERALEAVGSRGPAHVRRLWIPVVHAGGAAADQGGRSNEVVIAFLLLRPDNHQKVGVNLIITTTT